MMGIYVFREGYGRRYLRGYCPLTLDVHKRKTCSSCGNVYTPDSHRKTVSLLQGNFVSNILWDDYGRFHATEPLKDAFQEEGFEGIEFESTEIVRDERPNRDKIKLPLERIPKFYRVKFLRSIPLHQDCIERYGITYCPKCGYETRGYEETFCDEYEEGPLILDKKHNPGTDFFEIEAGIEGCHAGSICGLRLCTEKGKAFLDNYPKTYCGFVTEIDIMRGIHLRE